MIDWIFEGIANWVASIMTQVMDAVSGVFLEALGTDMTAMEEYFPFVTAAYSIMQYTAWALLFLIVVWQLFRTFGGPITEAEHPFELLARGALFAFLITYAKPIFSLVLEIARAPYTALMESSLDPGDFIFAGIEQALTSGLTTIVSVATVVGLILLIVMMIALGWNYFKLLLETVERYVLVGVLCYTSPLAYAMGASKSTSRVFQSWCRMVGSQLLLLVLNVWFLRAFNSSVGHFVANGGALISGQGNIFLWIFCALALLKIAQRADSYLAAMGLSVAQTGSSMGMEMLMAARLITGLGHGGNHNAGSTFTSAARGAATGTTAGAAGSFMSGFTTRYSPNSFVRDAVVDGGSRMGAGGSVGFVGRTFGGMAARNGATLNSTSIASVATRPNNVSGTIADNIADRSIGILIRNEIYNELERGTRYTREVSSCYLELEDDPRQEDYEQQLRCRELMSLLDRAEATATGITAKGIRALRMMCDGYSCREISAHYDTTPNNITAWMSKARKYPASFAQLSPSV